MDTNSSDRSHHREPWNKGKLVGQKAPFKPKGVWSMPARLTQEHRTRELALLNLGIDSKLRGCDLVALRVRDLQHGGQLAPRAIITQHKTGRPVQFEITAADARGGPGLDRRGSPEARGLPVPEPNPSVTAHLHAAVCADAAAVGA